MDDCQFHEYLWLTTLNDKRLEAARENLGITTTFNALGVTSGEEALRNNFYQIQPFSQTIQFSPNAGSESVLPDQRDLESEGGVIDRTLNSMFQGLNQYAKQLEEVANSEEGLDQRYENSANTIDQEDITFRVVMPDGTVLYWIDDGIDPDATPDEIIEYLTGNDIKPDIVVPPTSDAEAEDLWLAAPAMSRDGISRPFDNDGFSGNLDEDGWAEGEKVGNSVAVFYGNNAPTADNYPVETEQDLKKLFGDGKIEVERYSSETGSWRVAAAYTLTENPDSTYTIEEVEVHEIDRYGADEDVLKAIEEGRQTIEDQSGGTALGIYDAVTEWVGRDSDAETEGQRAGFLNGLADAFRDEIEGILVLIREAAVLANDFRIMGLGDEDWLDWFTPDSFHYLEGIVRFSIRDSESVIKIRGRWGGIVQERVVEELIARKIEAKLSVLNQIVVSATQAGKDLMCCLYYAVRDNLLEASLLAALTSQFIMPGLALFIMCAAVAWSMPEHESRAAAARGQALLDRGVNFFKENFTERLTYAIGYLIGFIIITFIPIVGIIAKVGSVLTKISRLRHLHQLSYRAIKDLVSEAGGTVVRQADDAAEGAGRAANQADEAGVQVDEATEGAGRTATQADEVAQAASDPTRPAGAIISDAGGVAGRTSGRLTTRQLGVINAYIDKAAPGQGVRITRIDGEGPPRLSGLPEDEFNAALEKMKNGKTPDQQAQIDQLAREHGIPLHYLSNYRKGVVGEAMADALMRSKGYERLGPGRERINPLGQDAGANQIDALYEAPYGSLVVVEVKYTAKSLTEGNMAAIANASRTLQDGSRQMDDAWINQRLGRMRLDANTRRKINDMAEDGEPIQTMYLFVNQHGNVNIGQQRAATLIQQSN